MNTIDLCEKGYFPDVLTRYGMRKLIRERLSSAENTHGEARSRAFEQFMKDLRSAPIAIETKAANAQHYEVPAAFFHAHLGPQLKYSCCLYPSGNETLAEAEQHMLELYAQRAGLKDGMRILDLGCGWGSLSTWLAKKYPNSQIVGLSNSNGQREFINNRCKERGLTNLTIHTGNVAEFDFSAEQLGGGFDRVMSIEMFEHMKNYERLMAKIARWLKPGGKLFVHIFIHKTLAYHYEDKEDSDWMTRYFFLGGTMPSENLLLHFQDDLKIEQQWYVDGRHYEKTSNHWLAGMDAKKPEILALLRQAYGEKDAAIWVQRWRMFYMAVAEFFGIENGNEWGVGHYLFVKR